MTRQNERRLRKLETAATGMGRLYVLKIDCTEPDQEAIAGRLIAEAGYPPPSGTDAVLIVRGFFGEPSELQTCRPL